MSLRIDQIKESSKTFENRPYTEPKLRKIKNLSIDTIESKNSIDPTQFILVNDFDLDKYPELFHDVRNNLNQPSEISDSSHSKMSLFSKLKSCFGNILQPSDNKLSLKMFGSKKGILKEKARLQKIGRFIIHPYSNFKLFWSLLMLILLILNVIILPLTISFFNDHWSHPGLLSFNLISDAFFLIDIILKFRTGYIVEKYGNQIVLQPKKIAKNYVKTWFFIDLLSSIPFDYIFLLIEENDEKNKLAQTGRAFKVLRLIKLLALLRLLRFSHLIRNLHQWGKLLSIASMVIRIIKLVGTIILLAHWHACLQFLLPMLQSFPAESWVGLNKLEKAPWTEQYSYALFKALSHMLCIGYGRYPPQTYTDMWLTMLSMVSGAWCYAVTVGIVSALIQNHDPSGQAYNQKIAQVKEYMAWRKFPHDLRDRIAEYYEHRYQGKLFDEDDILNEISEKLKSDIINHNCRYLVAAAPLFANADQNFITDLLTKLKFEIFQPGDIICREGTIGKKMYFIQDGKVSISNSKKQVIAILGDGSFFGEICLLTRATRVASCQAMTYCSLYSLSVEDFHNVLDQYPIMKQKMESLAAERLNKLYKTGELAKKNLDDGANNNITAQSDISNENQSKNIDLTLKEQSSL